MSMERGETGTTSGRAARWSNARWGWGLFVVYLVCYGGFVGLNAWSAETMEWSPAAGVNLAVWYGLGLIAFALVLALVYGFVCRGTGNAVASESGEERA